MTFRKAITYLGAIVAGGFALGVLNDIYKRKSKEKSR